MYDIMIIGSGPAGLTAALYAGRANLGTVVFETYYPGGQMGTTYEVDNYPGLEATISGGELSYKFEQQARRFGAEIKTEGIERLDLSGEIKKVYTSKGEYTGRAVILAMGASPRPLGVPGEDTFKGAGVSYCATCDGAFFREKNVAVVGGGDTALEDAIFLSRYCQKVYLIHRRGEFRGAKSLQENLKKLSNVEILYHTIVKEISGSNKVEGITVQNTENGAETALELQGVFIAVGTMPKSDLVRDILSLTAGGYIPANEQMETAIKGVYAAGDIREKQLRQIITAASDGAIAAYNASLYVEGM